MPVTYEFSGIIPIRVGSTATGYRDGTYSVTNPYKYHESFVDLRMSGPRVAQLRQAFCVLSCVIASFGRKGVM